MGKAGAFVVKSLIFMKIIPKKIKPRFMPRDFLDWLVMLFVGLFLQVVLLFVLPSILVFFATAAFGLEMDTSILSAVATYVLLYLLFLTFTVWSLQLSEDGIKFVRFFGSPRLLRWGEIVDISEASRKEVIIRGWLWPLFPAREMTPCMSALRHFRFRWNSGYCYFPPADPDTFLQLIDEFRNNQSA
jgi:hypothetical protein